MTHVVIWTLKRGKLDPPEPVDEDTGRRIQRSLAEEFYPVQRKPQWIIDEENQDARMGG